MNQDKCTFTLYKHLSSGKDTKIVEERDKWNLFYKWHLFPTNGPLKNDTLALPHIIYIHIFKKCTPGTGDMGQQLKALAALPEDQDLVPCTPQNHTTIQ